MGVPRSALSLVQNALVAVHAAVGLRATLEAIAEGVTTSTPFQEVAVTIAKEPNAAELHVVAVIASPEARDTLLGTTCRRDAVLEHMASGEAWGTLRFHSAYEQTEGILTYLPDYTPLEVPDAWRPEYELIAPLYAPKLLQRIEQAFADARVETAGGGVEHAGDVLARPGVRAGLRGEPPRAGPPGPGAAGPRGPRDVRAQAFPSRRQPPADPGEVPAERRLTRRSCQASSNRAPRDRK